MTRIGAFRMSLQFQISSAAFCHLPCLSPPPPFLIAKNIAKPFEFIHPKIHNCSLAMSWACSKCTYLNPETKKSSCEICLSPPSPSPPLSFTTSSHITSSSSSSSVPTWSCTACTYLNSYARSNCEICGTRAFSSLSSFEDLTADTDGGSGGSIFFPLRRCDAKSTCLVGKSGESVVNRKRKAGYGGGDEVVDLSSDEAGAFRGVKGSKKANAASEKAEASSNADTKKAAVENADSGKSLGTIKILSYNVWFREDLEMVERIRAIGNLIHLHSPDVICLQEVTPNIYYTFQKSGWWKKYKCSISPELADRGAYFCMLLTKLPVRSFSKKPFRNSIMGRELCISEIDLKAEDKSRPLVVATSHLESPCPAPPTWNQMFSKERVEQAKESIKILQEHPNVVFCGDMNWDDKLDGSFPLPEGWVDAWFQLRPTEDGFTYDTKFNKMLSGNRSLRKRLDRFLCSLRDFKISRIQMIGTEEILGLSHTKEKKGKNGIQKLVLPVLPSDHFGLLLTITQE